MFFAILLFFLVLVIPPFFITVQFGKRFEEVISVSSGLTILIMFLCGILGFLETGVYVVLGISLILIILSIYTLVRGNDKTRNRLKGFFAPSLLAFCLVFIFLLYVHHGRLVHEWDEFSHWGSVVKAMTYVNDFSTNPNTLLSFQSYVPGMALFQYLFQKILMLFQEGQFADWGLYFCYHLLAFIFLLSFFSVRSWKIKIFLPALVVFICIAVIPSFLQEEYLTSIYIDSFVGLLAGTGFALLFLRQRTKTTLANLLMICSVLVLMKDIGLLFATMIGLTFIIWEVSERKDWKKVAIDVALIIVAVALPKILWEMNLRANHIEPRFRQPIDLNVLIRVLTGLDNSYLYEVLKRYCEALVSYTVLLGGGTGVSVGYPLLSLLMIVGLLCIRSKFLKRIPERKSQYTVVCIMMILMFVIYLLGLPIIYMFRFDEYEAIRLASLGRYLSIVYDCFIVMGFLLFAEYMQARQEMINKGLCISIVLTALLLNSYVFYRYLNRASVKASISYREKYASVVDPMVSLANGEEKKVWIITQASDGRDYLPIAYGIRPCCSAGNAFSISANRKSLYDGDIWTVQIGVNEWREKLKEFDYVIIFYVNDSFKEDYASLFKNPNDIENDHIFEVNHETDLLVRVV